MSVNTIGYVADPPLYYFTGLQYNPDFYTENGIGNSGSITKAYLDATYLRKIGVANSSATVTNFFGPVTCSQGLTLTGGIACDSIIVSGSASIANLNISTITASTITASTIAATTSMNTNLIINSSATLPVLLSTTTNLIPVGTSATAGLAIGWNPPVPGSGQTNFINYGQASLSDGGGFLFSALNTVNPISNFISMVRYIHGGLYIHPNCGQISMPDRNLGSFTTNISQTGNVFSINSNGTSTSISLICGDTTGALTNVISANTIGTTIYGNLNPASNTTFNSFHPTTSLGNNISTNTTQYATVGFVNSVIPAIPVSLLGLNNVWTGTNAFNNSIPTTTLTPTTATQMVTKSYVDASIPASLLPLNNSWTGLNNYSQRIEMTIKTDPSSTCLGTGSGGNLGTLAIGSNITLIGQSSGLLEVNSSNETICGGGSGPTVLGNYSGNAVIGSSSQYLGNNNTIVGSGAGNFSTTVAYSNSTCLGFGSLMTSSNQITLGRVTETVLIPGNFTVAGQVKLSTSTYTAAISNVLTFIPMTIFFTPIAGMGFVLPLPSAANSGQTFALRKINAGSGTAIIFSAGVLATVWCALNSSVAANQYSLLAVWQSVWLSNGSLFFQIS